MITKQEKKKINITIKNRWTGEVIYESEKTTYKEAIEEAIRNRANLSWANLSRADLSKANLSWANLSKADLSKADLSKANLSKADLSWATIWFGSPGYNSATIKKYFNTFKNIK